MKEGRKVGWKKKDEKLNEGKTKKAWKTQKEGYKKERKEDN